jgi:hypothetical protein
MLFKIKFQAYVASPPTAVMQALSSRRVENNPFCHMATLAADGEHVCILQDWRYSKEHMFQHVSGCSCFTYMNDDYYTPNATIRGDLCQTAYEATYPCFWVSTMHF